MNIAGDRVSCHRVSRPIELALCVLMMTLGCADRARSPNTGGPGAKPDDRSKASQTPPAVSVADGAEVPLVPPTLEAMETVRSLRAKLDVPGPSEVKGFRRDPVGLRAQFTQSPQQTPARVVFPNRSKQPFEVEDVASGASVKVALKGAHDVEAQVADDFVVYTGAHASGATLLHRASSSGTEDYLSFAQRPPSPSVSYQVTLGKAVSGLRLVENVLEMIDAAGTPRLRVEPPYVVGTDGVRTDAILAIDGCAFDRSPEGPWGRPATRPGAKTCTVRVSWTDKAVEYPAVLDPRWTATTGAMVSKRQEHSSTLLSTGKVLIVGGRDSTGTTGATVLASAELFDPATGTWAATGSMTGGARRLHSATQLNTSSNTTTSGKVLVAGGISGASPPVSVTSAQLYTVSGTGAGTWTAAANLNAARHQHTATLLSDGQVLVTAGVNTTSSSSTVLNTAAKYNPASGTGAWTATGTLSARQSHTATLLVVPGNTTLNNKVLVVGGNSGSASISSVQLFDGASTWTTLTALSATREGHTATALANGNILVTGGKSGSTPLNTALLFNAASGSGSWASAGTMSVTRFAHTATLLPASVVKDGQVLVAGGTSDGTTPHPTSQIWNGGTTWVAAANMSSAVRGHTATLLSNNRVLLAGGMGGTTATNPTNSAQLYDASIGLTCTTNSQCASGFCAPGGVCCTAACTGGCESCTLPGLVGICSPKPNATVCRVSAGACDVAETCNGTATTCPADGFAPSSTSCRNAADQCDVAEFCSGFSATCPTDSFKTLGTPCTDEGNVCTKDQCDGTSATCKHPAGNIGTVCRNATGPCDVAETCNGSITCPADTFAPASTTCRSAVGECDIAELCSGSSAACPTDTVKTVATTCGDDGNACTTDKCDGTTGICRHQPGNVGTPCRAAIGPCDVAEVCNGTTACPADTFASAATICRAASGQCDLPETCTGSSAACPADILKANNTGCDDGNACTQTDTCQGGTCTGANPVSCPAPDQCRAQGTCNPSSGACSHPALSDLDGSGAPRLCDDGNSCTTGDRCMGGTCLPGETMACVESSQPFFAPLTNLGSANGESYAVDINDDGIVTGLDASNVDEYSHAGQGFRWTPTGVTTHLPNTGDGSYPFAINSSGVVTGLAFTGVYPNEGTMAFRHAPGDNGIGIFDARAARGTAINNAGTITGNAWFPGVHMYRTLGLGDPLEELRPPTGAYSRGYAIDATGNVYGDAIGATDTAWRAARYTNADGFQWLNTLLTPQQRNEWDLVVAFAVSGNQVVGWGFHNGYGRAFRLIPGSGGAASDIVDLGFPASSQPGGMQAFSMSASRSTFATQAVVAEPLPRDEANFRILTRMPHPPTATKGGASPSLPSGTDQSTSVIDPNPAQIVVAHDINSAGEIVGALYGSGDSPATPRAAFIWVEGQMIPLNDLVDPDSRWDLLIAYAINNPRATNGTTVREVVGLGTLDGAPRAYRMQLPDLRPCPAVECRARPVRDLRTGLCPTSEALADGTACSGSSNCGGVNNVCVAGICGGNSDGEAVCLRVDGIVNEGAGKYTAVFGYSNDASTSQRPTPNQVVLNGAVVSPQPAPPSVFHPTDQPHIGAFLPTFNGGKISWRVKGQMVTAEVGVSQPLTPIPKGSGNGSGYDVDIGGQIVSIKPDLSTPQPPPMSGDPAVDSEFNGTLTGQLSVSPTGAATYSLPIAIPPGIAGMSPNLSLNYSSQGGDGIAGQGWELGGLSMIYRCPKTRLQDGEARPVHMNILDGGDGYCLDGKRLFFNESSGSYVTTTFDFSTIKKDSNNTFSVVTKSGETRYYGSRANARVLLPDSEDTPPVGPQIAVWALDRVVDAWGNYFDVHYNKDQSDFVANGITVSRIDYTGHLASSTGSGSTPYFYSVTFDYRDRPDVRHTRFANSTLPRKSRLTTISVFRSTDLTHALRTYSLKYIERTDLTQPPTIDELMLPSRLESITYCAGGSCLAPLTFEWEGGNYSWRPSDTTSPTDDTQLDYRLPIRIDRHRTPNNTWQSQSGGQFIDLNGDGRVDIIQARHGLDLKAWVNTGRGFSPALPAWNPPINLFDGDGDPAGTVLADVDGDGLLDMITNRGQPSCPPRATQGMPCPQPDPQVTCVPEGLLACGTNQRYTPYVYLNRIKNEDRWVGTDFGLLPSNWNGINLLTDIVVDMDDDGRVDLVRFGSGQDSERNQLKVLHNTGSAWVTSSIDYDIPASLAQFGPITAFHLEDINRDGLPDLVSKVKRTAEGFPDHFIAGINTGSVPTATGDSVWKVVMFDADRNADAIEGTRVMGDVDGDGFHDPVFYTPPVDDPNLPIADCIWDSRCNTVLGTGVGYTALGAEDYRAALAAFTPNRTEALTSSVVTYHNMADINGDGLGDLILNHFDGGQLLINTGTTWIDLHQSGHWTNSAGLNPIPVVPSGAYGNVGATFVDLNGDGVTDLVQSTVDPQGNAVNHAWINTFRPPVIRTFPNGLAARTEVAYRTITTTMPLGVDTYADPSSLNGPGAGNTYLALPLRVVESVLAEDGSATGTKATTSYKYRSLRNSSSGYGPQGFAEVIVTDPSGLTTSTTYSQTYPSTGMPTQVVRKKNVNGNLISMGTTITQYAVFCGAACQVGGGNPSNVGPSDSLFVYPRKVIDTSFLWGATLLPSVTPGRITTTTEIGTDTAPGYDGNGNPILTTVTTTSSGGETYKKTISNTYGASNSRENLDGKLTKSITTTERLAPIQGHDTVKHITEFEYTDVATYSLDGQSHSTLALSKKIVERPDGTQQPPDPPADPLNVVEMHTAYAYDRFGNVITTNNCASDFDHCTPDAAGPVDLPFRRTTVSYDPNDFNAPSGSGLTPTLSYGAGRFPVKTTNAAGHIEYSAYDPDRGGVLLQRTGPNGVHTCYEYTAFGVQRLEKARCGSGQPLITTVKTYRTAAVDPLSTAFPVVTVTTPPTGAVTWAYSDVLGRTRETRARALNGGFIQMATTTYDSLGRTSSQTKPRFDRPEEPTFSTTRVYDGIGRVLTVTQRLGQINASSTNATSVTETTYQGSTILTEETITEGSTQVKHKRWETKNTIGKVSSVKDDVLKEITYVYDADGNLTDTIDPNEHVVHVDYDKRGRKTLTNDPDMGQLTYRYNGFGEVVRQTDAKNIQPTTMKYDRLGRMTEKTDASGTAAWVYDAAPGGIGKLVAAIGAPDPHLVRPCTVPVAVRPYVNETDGNRALKWFAYASNGDLEETSECADGDTFSTHFDYDPLTGRQSVIRYPEVNGNQLAVKYHYTGAGYLHYLTDLSDDSLYWVARDRNAQGQVTKEFTKNGVETVSNRNPSTGWLMASVSTSQLDGHIPIQDWAYQYDEAGNLRRRTRSDWVNTEDSDEVFTYDTLNRLKTSHVTTTAGYEKSDSYGYDSLGNLTEKDGKVYGYVGCMAGGRAAGPHAVCSVVGEMPFVYDANGNMTSGRGRTVTYNTSNRPSEIVSATTTVTFAYGPDGHRVVQSVTGGGSTARTRYVGLGATGKSLYERTERGTVKEHVQYIYAGDAHGGNAFALRVVTEGGGPPSPAVVTKYYHFDHLGSVTAMSDEYGHVADTATAGADAGVLGYDPWGARRSPEGRTADPASFNQQVGHREFTGHETIPDVGLVNMNGRVYDPVLGRFLSPDPNVQFVADLQSYNRYSYVLNNPLRYTDPTGYFLNGAFDALVNATLTIAAFAACSGPQAVACTAAFLVAGLTYNTVSSINSGAPWDQAVAINLVGLGFGGTLGALGGGAGAGLASLAGKEVSTKAIGQILGGAIGGAFSTIALSPVAGQGLGWNILTGAAQGAMMAALLAAAQAAPLSIASIEQAQGGTEFVGADNGPPDLQSADGLDASGSQERIDRINRTLVPDVEKGTASGIRPRFDQDMEKGVRGEMTKEAGRIVIRIGPDGVAQTDTGLATTIRHEYDHADRHITGRHPNTRLGAILIVNGRETTLTALSLESAIRFNDAMFAAKLGDFATANSRLAMSQWYQNIIRDFVETHSK